jgi:acyl-CoA dehydrogenase
MRVTAAPASAFANTPEEYGGMDLGAVMSAIVAMECGRSFVPFAFGG